MRYLILAAAVGGLVAASSNVSPAQAQSRGYPFCLISKNTTGYGDCSYSTIEQCRATASGQQAECDRNYALDYYGQQQSAERPIRRSRTYRVQ
jgi:hypothetical protein